MAVSKRLRYEILRRDNHACRYCGGTAPDVTLTVDHVTPVALGGSDAPSNLVAACKDCNSGKSATPAGAPLIADVASDAVRWAGAMRVAADDAAREREQHEALHTRFADLWDSYTFTGMGVGAAIPDDWARSVDKMLEGGLTIGDLLHFAEMALGNTRVRHWDKFRYFCGIAWRTLTERQEQARAVLAGDTPSTEREDHCAAPADCWVHGEDGANCERCGALGCDWACGFEYGGQSMWRALHRRDGGYARHVMDALRVVVDKEPVF